MTDPAPRCETGTLLLRNGREQEGVRWLISALRNDPLYRPAHKALADHYERLGKRDLAHNINFFMNVPVSLTGELTFADGVSAVGRYVELRAERDVLAVLSNCPQMHNPCNGYNPTPVRVTVRG